MHKQDRIPDLSSADWEQRYQSGNTPWDLSGPTPEFMRLIKEPWFPKGPALVPGGGRGHDAILLARNGIETDLVDFAPTALLQAQSEAHRAKVTLHTYLRDFFDLPDTAYHQERYSLILEYTFFCAIDPNLREKYVRTVHRLLKPGGYLVGLFFPMSSDKEGPPFLVSEEEVRSLFSPSFSVRIEAPKESVKPRAGREFLGIFRKN